MSPRSLRNTPVAEIHLMDGSDRRQDRIEIEHFVTVQKKKRKTDVTFYGKIIFCVVSVIVKIFLIVKSTFDSTRIIRIRVV